MKPGDLILRKAVVNLTGSLPNDPQLIIEEFINPITSKWERPHRMYRLVGIYFNNIEETWEDSAVFIERYFDVISSGSSG